MSMAKQIPPISEWKVIPVSMKAIKISLLFGDFLPTNSKEQFFSCQAFPAPMDTSDNRRDTNKIDHASKPTEAIIRNTQDTSNRSK